MMLMRKSFNTPRLTWLWTRQPAFIMASETRSMSDNRKDSAIPDEEPCYDLNVAFRSKRKGKSFKRPDGKEKMSSRLTSNIVNALLTTGENVNPLDVLHMVIRPDPIVATRKFVEVEKDLKDALARRFPDAHCEPFGSQITGTAFVGSDLDFFVELSPQGTDDSPGKIMNDVIELMIRSGKFNNFNAVTATLVPVLKCKHLNTRFRCDINFSDPDGIYGSVAMARLLQFDQRLFDIAIIIKHWMKINGYIDPSKFSSYITLWLVIHYFQSQNIVPPIAEFQKNVDPIVLKGGNFAFDQTIQNRTSNWKKRSKLLQGFFEFYKDFDFETLIISPLHGKSFTKSEFLKEYPEAEQTCTQLKNVQTAEDRDDLKRVVSIHNPFVNSIVIQRRFGSEDFAEFRLKLSIAAYVIRHTLNETGPNMSAKLLVNLFDRVQLEKITNVTMPESVMVGSDCYPHLEMKENPEDYTFEWFKGLPEGDSDIKWIKCGESFTYKVAPEDLHHYLKVVCTQQEGPLAGIRCEPKTKTLVEGGPELPALIKRHSFTSSRLPKDGNQFRVVSYNTLADCYARSDYYTYCHPDALTANYRKQLLNRELVGLNSDIICLQEVDSKLFGADLRLTLGAQGFKGRFDRKMFNSEGLAIFHRDDKYERIDNHCINFGDALSSLPLFDKIFDKVHASSNLVSALRLPSILQVTVLKLRAADQYMIVANTHLSAKIGGDDIRLVQIGMSMAYLETLYEKMVSERSLSPEQISIIFCGDFNSQPHRGVYKLMTEKVVPHDYADYSCTEENAISNLTLRQPFNIKSAYGTPEFTNFTENFNGCLDYVFYQTDNLQLNQVVPLPSKEVVERHTALPSVAFPSDHISLIADFEWTK